MEDGPQQPGWYVMNADDEGIERWWTGEAWSEYTRRADDPDVVTQTAVAAEAPSSDEEHTDLPPGTVAADDATVHSPAQPAASTPPPSGGFIPPAQPAANTSMQDRAVGFMDRLARAEDSGETGWDRNLATLIWIPFLSSFSFFAYVIAGSQMTRQARAHIAGALNLIISAVLLGIATYVIWGVSAADQIWQGGVSVFGIILFVLVGAVFGLWVLLFTKRETEHNSTVGAWVWFGVWCALGLILTIDAVAGAFLVAIVVGPLYIALFATNIVRARLGMEPHFLGLPVIPVLSRR